VRLFTKKQLDRYVTDEVIADRLNHSQTVATEAAKAAVHYYVAWRTLDEWRSIIDEAEKQGEKYISLAKLIVEAGIKK